MKQQLLLKNELRSAIMPWKKEAAKHLSLSSFEKFCLTVEASTNYTVNCSQDSIIVRRLGSEAAGRTILPSQRCNCVERVAYMAPCRHEVAMWSFQKKELFDQKKFHVRHIGRSGLDISYAVGNNVADDESGLVISHADLKIGVDGGNDERNTSGFDVSDDNIDGNVSISCGHKKITYNMMKNVSMECANECLRWKSEGISKLFMGLMGKTLDFLKDPRGADASWVAAEVGNYASAFFNSCKTAFRGVSGGGQSKRRKSVNENIQGNRKKVCKFSEKAVTKEKACSSCGESFLTGHHTSRNCPNAK